jgi:integrase
MQTVDNFLDSLKSQRTKEQYAYHLIRFKNWSTNRGYLSNHGKTYSHLEDQPDNLRMQAVIEYLTAMKAEGLSYSSRNGAKCALKHYYIMNDVVLNWEKISKFLGENTSDNDLRGYKREEIQKLLTVSDVKYKAVILMLASTGMRREALVQINTSSDMEYLDDYKLYKIRIYRRTKYEQVCFSTPEASEAIKLHLLSHRRQLFHGVHPKAISIRLRNLSVKAGLGQVHPDTELSKHGQFRDAIPAVHGLRKFCITQMARAKVDTEIAKLLTGHSIGVRSKYLNYSDDDLLAEYVKAIDYLTINQENILKKKIERLTVKDNEIEELRKEFEDIKATMRKKIEGS